jgi:amino acid transporter
VWPIGPFNLVVSPYFWYQGAVFGLTASTFTGLLGQPRIFYRMSVDGLLFPFFSKLSKRSVPIVGSILTGIVTALIAFFIGLEALADAISIGTLFAFSVVDAGVIVQRRKDPHDSQRVVLAIAVFVVSCFIACMSFQNVSQFVALSACVVVSVVLCCGLSQNWSTGVTAVFGTFTGLALVYMHFLPVNDIDSSFRCPLVPLIPCIGIGVNLSMMTGVLWNAVCEYAHCG